LFKQYKTFYEGKGCEDCSGTGYKGRISLHEVLEVTDQIREEILKKSSATKIKEIAIKNGMVTMGQDGLLKASQGLTTISEVLRISYE
jgi:type II secretory ATPase GspE/PulE/Tfp pilus assembly ATPase PilB-like protein